MRTVIAIPEEQLALLAKVCRQENIARAQAIRQALAVYLDRHAGGGSRGTQSELADLPPDAS
jgi:metal-responsive CopG/Arc/MetJ family transcriptional regulator